MAITVNGGQPTANLTLSAELSAAITDESGTGALVFATSPTLTTPTLGTASATAIELGHATDTTIARASAGVVSIEGNAVLVSGGALGTPASGTLTNATGLPVSGITASTSSALGVGSVELGHATDTTIARVSAGVVSIEGSTILVSGGALGTPSSGTLTNATDLPIAGLTASTSSALGVGSVELGHATDTTLARVSAGVMSIEGVEVTTNSGTQTLTAKTLTSPTITGGTLVDAVVRGLEEDVNIVASAATGTINFNIETASIWYYTTNATANHTLNFRYSSTVSLNTALAVGDAITVVWMNTNGVTAYYPNAFQIDGSSVTPKVGTAITAGNASSIDAYSFTIIKTASATFTVLETQSKFA